MSRLYLAGMVSQLPHPSVETPGRPSGPLHRVGVLAPSSVSFVVDAPASVVSVLVQVGITYA